MLKNNYKDLLKKMCLDNPEIKITSEYAYFIKNDLLRFLIRLARYKFVAKMLNKKDDVLEIGCGSGIGAIFMSQYCKSVLGIDLHRQEIKEANSINRRQNLKFKNKDFFSIPDEKKYDVITALDVIEHMNEKEGRKLVGKVGGHLREGGMAIFGTPSIYSYEYQGELSKAAHIKLYDLEEFKNLFRHYFGRILTFSMNDELVHTGHPKMAWYYFIIALIPKENKK